MVLAEFGTGQVLWSIVWLSVFILWAYLVIAIWSDLLRSHDISGAEKALWAAMVIFLPFLGYLLYMLIRGDGMSERLDDKVRRRDVATTTYLQRQAAAPVIDELADLSAQRAAGTLTPDQYEQAKRELLGG